MPVYVSIAHPAASTSISTSKLELINFFLKAVTLLISYCYYIFSQLPSKVIFVAPSYWSSIGQQVLAIHTSKFHSHTFYSIPLPPFMEGEDHCRHPWCPPSGSPFSTPAHSVLCADDGCSDTAVIMSLFNSQISDESPLLKV